MRLKIKRIFSTTPDGNTIPTAEFTVAEWLTHLAVTLEVMGSHPSLGDISEKNFETVKATRKISMNRDYETGFRFRQQNLCETLPSGDITMTSHQVGNKTSLSQIPCIPDEQLLWNAINKSRSLFQNPS